MNKAAALTFLQSHSPMPDDPELSDSECEQFDEVVTFIRSQPTPDLIGPLFRAFGRWSGRGMYQVALDAFASFSDTDALQRELSLALQSPHESVRYWAAQASQVYGGAGLRSRLEALLQDPNEDIRVASATALEDFGTEETIPLLRAALNGMSPENTELTQEIIEELRSKPDHLPRGEA